LRSGSSVSHTARTCKMEEANQEYLRSKIPITAAQKCVAKEAQGQ
jgi:hypothetical protein